MLKWLLRKKNNTVLKNTPPQIGIVPKKFIKNFLPGNPVIVEGGAHTGLDTIEMAELWPRGMIFAFEPVPQIFKTLVRNTKRFRNVRRYPLALGERTGKHKMFISGGANKGSSSLLPPKEHLVYHPDVCFNETIEVSTTTLDSWAVENDVSSIDFLWLDMQGYEIAALKASTRILKTVKAIYTEVMLKELYEGCPLYAEARDWLKEQNFRVEREELAWGNSGNVLFIRNN